MLRILFLIYTFTAILNASSIDDKIENNKYILNKSNQQENQTKVQIQQLATQISEQSNELSKLEKEIELVTKDINEHEELLEKSKKELSKLSVKTDILQNQKRNYEEELINAIIEDYSSSVALKLADKNSLDELIESEIYDLLSSEIKDKMLKTDSEYIKVTQDKLENQREIKKLNTYIQKRQKKKKVLNYLLSKHSDVLTSIEEKHKKYQDELKNIIKKQNSLTSLLSQLNILKVEEEKKEEQKRRELLALKEKREKAKEAKRLEQVSNATKVVKTQKDVQESYAEDIDLDVRILGSSTKGVKISRYRGEKSIAPLKYYSIAKKFGKYYDPVYKIQLFNESVLLKTTEPDAKVYNVLDGKVVYSKENAGMLDNVVIVQHKNGLHTIYSHLDQISPTLKTGKWIKQGYVVGRVNETLTFQATKNNMHINPEDLFN